MSTRAIPRVSDRHLIDVFVFKALRDRKLSGIPEEVESVSLSFLNGSATVNKDSFDEDGHLIGDDVRYLSESDSCEINTIGFRFYTPAPRKLATIYYTRKPDSFIDSLVADGNVLPSQLQFKAELTLALCAKAPSIDSTLEPQAFSAHHEVLSRLEGMSAKLIEDTHQQIRKLETEKGEFISNQSVEFEVKHQQLIVDFEDRQSRLEEEYFQRSQELDEREKAVEDADNTTARRQTTTKAIADIADKAKRFDFSSSVGWKMWLVFLLCILLAALGVISVLTAYADISKAFAVQGLAHTQTPESVATVNESYLWFNYVRILLSSALVVSTLVYLIRFFSSWMNKTANQELDNQKYVRDLNRAHVAIEMCLEWNDKKDGEIPERLLSAVTEGLFVDKAQSNVDINHPADQLASALIRTSDKLEFPLGSGTVTTSGKKISKAKTETQKANPEGEPAE